MHTSRSFSHLAALAVVLASGAAAGCMSGDMDVTRGGGGKFDESAYQSWRDGLYCEPEGGPCIVEGDIPIWGEEDLRDYYDDRQTTGELSVMQVESVDAVWDKVDRFELTYCVSDAFGARKQEAVRGMQEAVADWEELANVDFTYLPEEDGSCHPRSAQVMFPVRPSPRRARYIARAFFPNYPDKERDVRISFESFDSMMSDPEVAEVFTLRGVIRHELGHVLGFRHEHTRPEAEAPFCFEDENFRPLTEYDAASVMHYPQCNGEGNWSLSFTDLDRLGSEFFYPDLDAFTAERCDVELDAEGRIDETCTPVVLQILELANNASAEVLDDWVGLDVRAVDEVVRLRGTEPFNELQKLRDVSFLAEVGLRKMYDYLYVDGRCPVELMDDGLPSPACKPVVNGILELANTASFAELDDDVGLDRRAAGNIQAIRYSQPFTSLAELWEVSYVKTRALGKMYDYLYPEAP